MNERCVDCQHLKHFIECVDGQYESNSTLAAEIAALRARVRELAAMLAWAMTYVDATYEAEGDPIPSEQVLYLSARRAMEEARE